MSQENVEIVRRMYEIGLDPGDFGAGSMRPSVKGPRS